MRHFPLLIIFLFSPFLFPFGTAYGENHLVYFGGGQSSQPRDVLFDDDFISLLQYSKFPSPSWKSEFFYRKNIPAEVSESDKKNIKEFSPDSFQDRINSLKDDLRTGKIKSGEQLLIYIDTHGGIDKNKELVLTTDSGHANSEILQSLIALAEEKKVKLGIVGMNCYSGSLLRFKSPNTCIVTMSPSDKVSFGSDSFQVVKNILKKAGSTNLEEVFLTSRYRGKDYYDPAQPMISTEAGIAVDEALSSLKDGIFFELDLKNELLQPLCKDISLRVGSLVENLEKIAQVVKFSYKEQALPVTYKGPGPIVDLQRLEKIQSKLKSYQALYQQTKKFSALETALACSNDEYCLKAGEVDLYTSVVETEKEKQWLKEMRASSEYKRFKEVTKNQEFLYQRMNELSLEITREERELYDQLYKMTNQKMEGPNPCREFKL